MNKKRAKNQIFFCKILRIENKKRGIEKTAILSIAALCIKKAKISASFY